MISIHSSLYCNLLPKSLVVGAELIKECTRWLADSATNVIKFLVKENSINKMVVDFLAKNVVTR